MREHGFAPPTFTALNVSGEIIPPYACVQLTPVDGEFVGKTTGTNLTYFAATKPGEGYAQYDPNGPFVFNGANKVPVGGYGEFRIPASVPCLAMLNPDIDLEDAWALDLGPVDGEWYLDVGSGFLFGGVFEAWPDKPHGFVLKDSDASLVPVEITETETDYADIDDDYPDDSYGYGEEAVAIYRTSHPAGFRVRRLDCSREMIGDEFLCHADFITGVHWTGKQVWARQDDCGEWQLVADGADFWSTGVTQEAVDVGDTGYVELFEGGPIVLAGTKTGVATDTPVDVEFDEQLQEFMDTAQDCPATP